MLIMILFPCNSARGTGALNYKNTQCWVWCIRYYPPQVKGQDMVDNCSSPDLPSGVLTCAMVVHKVIAVELSLT